MKKLLSILLATLMLLTCIPMTAVSVSAATSGTTGDCTWTLNGTRLTISGNGAMGGYGLFYNGDDAPWGKNITSVTIANGVTTIGDYAFCECSNLTSLIIPDSVNSIGMYAFSGCFQLTSVTIPDSVTTIGEGAFSYCTSLTSVTISDGVTRIGTWAFNSCYNLTSVIIPNSVTFIGELAFHNSVSFRVAKDNPMYCADEGILFNKDKTALIQCPRNKSGAYVIPESVVSIATCAFFWCDKLTSVTIHSGITSIGSQAFIYCNNLKSFIVDNDSTSFSAVEGVLFNKNITKLIQYPGSKSGAYIIPNSVTTIESGAFWNCDQLTSVTISASMNDTLWHAFEHCAGLTEILVDKDNPKYSSEDGVLYDKDKKQLIRYPSGKTGAYSVPDSVISFYGGAFEFCYNIVSITLGESFFEGSIDCPNLTEILVDKNNPYYSSKDGVLFDKGKTTLIRYPVGKSSTTYSVPDSITTIWANAFYGCTSLTSVTIPDSVTAIDWCAFLSCDNLTDVNYTGTKTQAAAISIEKLNDPLLNATWHYNSCVGKAKHDYTNACDKSCNTCGATRTIKHDYKSATCTKAKTCKVCGATSGSKLGHSYKKVVTKATTTANGKVKNVCTRCNYTASKVTTIYKASSVKLSKTSYTYNGKVVKPTVVVKDSKGNKISSSNYTVTYASGRKNVGTYKVTIKFKGNYTGTKTLTFKVNPAKTTVKSLTAGKKSLKVAITKKATQVTGYQIQYSTTKSFKSYKTKTLSGYKKTSTTLTGLSAKKTYYVRVRTYKIVNGKKVYSAWSTVKSAKTK